MHKVTKTMHTETAHRLMLHPGKCKNLHGHSYKWEVTVKSGQINLNGMVCDFAEIKHAMDKVIDNYDHAVVLNCNDKDLIKFLEDFGTKVIRTLHEPTAEAMCRTVINSLNNHLPSMVVVDRVRLWETTTSYAECTDECV